MNYKLKKSKNVALKRTSKAYPLINQDAQDIISDLVISEAASPYGSTRGLLIGTKRIQEHLSRIYELADITQKSRNSEDYETAYAIWCSEFDHWDAINRSRFELYVALTYYFYEALKNISAEMASFVYPQLNPGGWVWLGKLIPGISLKISWDPELLQDVYTAVNPSEDASAFGKVFTPIEIADYILEKVGFPNRREKQGFLLDPSAGCGIFILAALNRLLINKGGLPELLHNLVALEIDPCLCNLARLNVAFWLCTHGLNPPKKHLRIFCTDTLSMPEADLFSKKAGIQTSEVDSIKLLEGPFAEGFYWIVGNPPYGKIHSSDKRTLPFKETVYGHANLYGLFIHFSLEHLHKENGAFGFIVPKSFSAGLYFKNLRRYLLRQLPLKEVVTFESRTDVFDKASVLQETVILIGDRSWRKDYVIIKSPYSHRDLTRRCEQIKVSLRDIDLGPSYEHILCITASSKALSILRHVKALSVTLEHVGYRASTGKFVWNRLKSHLRNEPAKNHRPLYWMHNLKPFKFLPYATNGKRFGYVELNAKTQPWLNAPEELVITKRISAKEQKRRIEAALIPETWQIGTPGYFIENHLNFIAKIRPSKVSLIFIMGVLNSKLLDFLFRIFNGNTQVSATELNLLPIAQGPEWKKVERLAMQLMKASDKEFKELEDVLNDAVYDLYGLNASDRKYVEQFFQKIGR